MYTYFNIITLNSFLWLAGQRLATMLSSTRMYFVRMSTIFGTSQHTNIERLLFSALFKPYVYMEGSKFIFRVFDVKMRIFGGLHCHEICS